MAHKINELKQAVLDAKADERRLLSQQDDAREQRGALLRRQAAGETLTETDTAALKAADEKLAKITGQLKAQRELIGDAEARHARAESEAAEENRQIAAARAEVVEDKADKAKFRTFGEKLQAVRFAATPGNRPDERLYQAAALGQQEAVASDGGYAVGYEYGSTILEKVYATGSLIDRVKKQPITVGNGIKIPAVDETSRADGSRSGGIRAYWVEEAGTITASQAKIRQNTLTLKKVAAVVYVTEELLADAAALEAWVNRNLPRELQFKIEDAIVNGDGAGKPLGWKDSPAVVSVAKETGQAAATIVYPNAVKMWARMWAPSRPTSVWLINQDCEPQLYQMAQTVGVGGSPVFLPAGGASAQPFSTLFGRPILPVEYCSTLGTVGDIQLVDPEQYTLANKGDVQMASSMHVQFLTDQMAFRFTMRVDGLPDWNAPLTPFKGTNTLSPFVTLATRA